MKQKLFLPILITGILLGSCKPKQENQFGNELGETEAKADPVYVEGVIAQLGDFPLELVSNGKLKASGEAALYFRKQAPIQSIKVQNGDWVKKGQVLAILENEIDVINLKQAEYQVESAEVEYKDKLLSHTAGGANEALTTEQARNYFELSSGLKNARLNLEKARMEVDHTVLTAPLDGRIADLSLKVNNMPSGADPFCRILDDRSFEVLFPVLESEIPRLKVGQKISMRTFVNDTLFYEGNIIEINPVVDEHGLVMVKGKVPNRDKRLIQGMNVKVFIKDQVPDCLIVPKESVVLRNNRQVVFTYKEGKAMWNYIQTVLENSTSYSIIRDAQEIFAGDTVITVGNLNLAHEAEVNFKMIQ